MQCDTLRASGVTRCEKILTMMRRFILWLFMALLPLQVALAACHGATAATSGHAAVVDLGQEHSDERFSHHWLDHEHGEPHHHHDDGSVHHADDQESQEHMGDHLGCQLTAMPHMGADLAVERLPDVAPCGHIAAWRPDPFLHEPARPPHAIG